MYRRQAAVITAGAIIALAHACAGAVPPGAAIVNVATGTYGTGGVDGLTVTSNEVTVTAAPNPTPSAIDMLVYSPSDPSVEQTVVPTTLWSVTGTESGPFALSPDPWIPTLDEPIDLSGPVPLAPARFYSLHESAFVRVVDPDENRNALVSETVVLTVSGGSTGDRELLRITEIAPDAGTFVGYIRLTRDATGGREHDGVLSVDENGVVGAGYEDATDPLDVTAMVVPVDPCGHVFDAETGSLLNGAVVTLVDVDTGDPATVFGSDGVSLFPATLTTGGEVSDGAGSVYDFSSGQFRFPFVTPGRYRLDVSPPPGYSSPSAVPTEELPELPVPGHETPIIDESGSRGGPFVLEDRPGFHMDFPLDPVVTTTTSLFLTKSTALGAASVGDFIRYDLSLANQTVSGLLETVVEDELPKAFRYQAGSTTIAGRSAQDPEISLDGRTLTFELGPLASGETVNARYVVEVAAGARPGTAVNLASARAAGGVTSNTATAAVEVREDLFRGRGIILGRVVEPGTRSADGGDAHDRGVGGIRIYLEDGTSAVTDVRGRYHFEDIAAGLHVVQLDVESLPSGYEASPVEGDSRFGGRAFSRFLDLPGGALKRADFRIENGSGENSTRSDAPAPAGPEGTNSLSNQESDLTDETALKELSPGLDWVAPEPGHHPHIPSVRVEVQHDPSHRLVLAMNGSEVDPRALDRTVENAEGTVAVTRWSGIDLDEGDARFTVTATDEEGSVVGSLERTVHYSGPPVHAALLPGESSPVADGRTVPVLAVRLTDRDGHPARTGVLGSLSVDPPYSVLRDREVVEGKRVEAVEEGGAMFTVDRDGVAFVELDPTSISGEVVLRFQLENGEHELRTWLRPEERDWILVGLAERTLGHRTAAGPRGGDGDLHTEGRTAFFARGMIRGDYLITLAYDSERSEGDEEFFREVDPDAFYAIYGDATEQTTDATTTGKLYVRLERERFYALHGDYATGLTVTELSRYGRTMNGFKSEFDSEHVGVTAFASESDHTFVRDEIRGDGTSGLYRLSRSGVTANSETVTLETRDRLDSNEVMSSHSMTRHADYDIDYGDGTLFFREPVPSRDAELNPIYVVVDYESDEGRDRSWVYGGRAAARFFGRALEVGGTLVSEGRGTRDDRLTGTDATIRLGANTTLSAEFARTEKDTDLEPVCADAYLVELRHRSGRLDGRAYIRELEREFGLGHQNAAETGTRRMGAEFSHRFTETLRLSGQAYRRYDLTTDARRDIREAGLHAARGRGTVRAGFRHAEDTFEDGAAKVSQQITAGGSYRILRERMLLRVDREQSLSGANTNPDFPTRTTLGADYRLPIPLTLFAEYELSEGEDRTDERTRAGAKATPWSGAQLNASLGQHRVESTGRVFANLGLKQTWRPREGWRVDAGLDNSRTVSGTDTVSVGPGGLATSDHVDDFTSVSLGIAHRGAGASWNSRVEHRSTEHEDRLGVVAGVHGEPAPGLGASLSARVLTSVIGTGPGDTDADLRLGLAFRPPGAGITLLGRVDLIIDGGGAEPERERIVGNANMNWCAGGGFEVSAQYGARYTLTDIDGTPYDSYTDLVGLEIRKSIGERWDVGARGSSLHSWDSHQLDYSAGASIGFNIVDGAWLGIGYNLTGFEDGDFDESGHSDRGPFLQIRVKFDQETARDLAELLSHS